MIWSTRYPRWHSWEGADFIVVHAAESHSRDGQPQALVVVDASGELGRASLRPGDAVETVTIADRAIYCVIARPVERTRRIVGMDTRGRTLWEVPVSGVHRSSGALMTLPSRLYYLGRNDENLEIVWLEEPS